MGAYNTTGFSASTGNVITTAATLYPFALATGSFFPGPAFVELVVTGAVIKGGFVVVGVVSLDIGDTTEAHASAGNQVVYRLCALPQAPYTLSFRCDTGGAAATALIRAIPNY